MFAGESIASTSNGGEALFSPRGGASSDPSYSPRVSIPDYTPLVDTPGGTGAACQGGSATKLAEELEQQIAQIDTENCRLQGQLKELERLWEDRKHPIANEFAQVSEALRSKEERLKKLHFPPDPSAIPPGPSFLRWVDGTVYSFACNLVIACNLAVMLKGEQVLSSKMTRCAESAFLVWYFFELALKACLHQHRYLRGDVLIVWWNWLDLFVVASGVTEEWLLPAYEVLSGERGSHGRMDFGGLRVLRLLRLFRLLRVLRILRTLLFADFRWTEGPTFQAIMMFAIALNSVLMGVELDLPWFGYAWIENALLALYCFELLARLMLWGIAFFVHETDWLWNRLDTTIVVSGVAEQWMLPTVVFFNAYITGSNGDIGAGKLIEALKVLRLLRVLRLFRLLRSIKPLSRLMAGIWHAMHGIQWVIVLTFVILYACAIMVTTLVGRGLIYPAGEAPAESATIFGSVSASLFNLFKLMCDDQSVVAPLLQSYFVQVVFILFMVVSNWAILAILTSVVSGHMISTTQHSEREEREKQETDSVKRRQRRLVKIFRELDEDGSGTIDDIEFKRLLHDEVLREELCDVAKLKLPDIMELFHSLSIEIEGCRRVLDYEDFIEKLHMEKKCATERSALRLEETLRALEQRNMQRFDAVLRFMGWEQHVARHRKPSPRKRLKDTTFSLTKTSI